MSYKEYFHGIIDEHEWAYDNCDPDPEDGEEEEFDEEK